MGLLGSAASWVVKSLLFAFLMSAYWFFRPPNNLLESFMAVVFCLVTSWAVVKILAFFFRSGG
ncbi:MAG: hypothetical protein AYK18_09830 [Theionarchaea archaeon DG-70]|nr:MAG: hypothetical protein AYK18_09830 [Theionarchaea archaeon DG-70]